MAPNGLYCADVLLSNYSLTVVSKILFQLMTELGSVTAMDRRVLSLYHNCDLITIQLRYDYDEKLTCSFFALVESHRMEAGARDTS